jgi:hypothetical protein
MRELKLRVQRQTTNVRQKNILRFKAIKSKWACCFKTRMLNYSCVICKKIWHAEIEQKLCQENSALPFAIPANVKLKLPIRDLIIRGGAVVRASALISPLILVRGFDSRYGLMWVNALPKVVFFGCSGFLPQGKLTEWVRTNTVKKVISQLLKR